MFFTLGSVMMNSFSFSEAHQDLFRFAYAAVLLAVALAYLLPRKGDPLYNVFITKAVAVATLGLAARYSGSTLSAWLAVETVVLLVSARRSGLVVTRILAIIVGAIAFLHGMAAFGDLAPVAYHAEPYSALAVQAVLSILAFAAASQLYAPHGLDGAFAQGHVPARIVETAVLGIRPHLGETRGRA